MKTKKRRWQFLWARSDDFPKQKWHERVYVAPTIEQACTKMIRWIETRGFEVEIDYEARAEHEKRYDPKQHEKMYPNLLQLTHDIRNYVT